MNNKVRSIIMFVPSSEPLRSVSGFYRAALKSYGFVVKSIDLRTSKNLLSDVTSAIDESLLFFLSFECDCTNLKLDDGESFYYRIKRPVISLCEGIPPFASDAVHAVYGLRDKIKVTGSSYFAPHPGMCIDEEVAERDIDVCFCYEPDAAAPGEPQKRWRVDLALSRVCDGQWREDSALSRVCDGQWREDSALSRVCDGQWREDSALSRVCDDMLDILIQNERVAATQAFEMVMDHHGIYLEDRGQNFKRTCISHLNSFMAGHRRSLLLGELTKSGIDATAIPSPGFAEYLRILKRSKIVLCVDAALEYSLPQTFACGMASGAVVAGSGNAFIDEVFTDSDYIPYSHNCYGILADRIKEMLGSPSHLAEVSENGRRIIQAGYTTAHAVEKFVLAADYSLLIHG